MPYNALRKGKPQGKHYPCPLSITPIAAMFVCGYGERKRH